MVDEADMQKKFDKKYEFFRCNLNCGMDNGEYKNWEATFLLLTKREKENLIKQTYNRMKIYNRKYKPKKWAGYNDKNGDEI